jgi:hypothetical protein
MIVRIVMPPNAAKHSRYFHVTKKISPQLFMERYFCRGRKVTFPVIFDKDSIQLAVISQLL